MSRERGKIEKVLKGLIHHTEDRKADQLWGDQFPGDRVPILQIQYRFNLVCEPLKAIADQMERIRAAANLGDVAAIRTILDEEIEYGHDFERLSIDDSTVGETKLFVRT